jgi:hypothetical protein
LNQTIARAVAAAAQRTSLGFASCDGTGMSTFVGELQRAIDSNPCMPY